MHDVLVGAARPRLLVYHGKPQSPGFTGMLRDHRASRKGSL